MASNLNSTAKHIKRDILAADISPAKRVMFNINLSYLCSLLCKQQRDLLQVWSTSPPPRRLANDEFFKTDNTSAPAIASAAALSPNDIKDLEAGIINQNVSTWAHLQ